MTNANNHLYSKARANQCHDRVVTMVAEEFKANKHKVSFPDKVDRNSSQPDMSIDGILAIEVKLINPTKNDWIVELKAREDWDSNKFASGGGTINTRPIEEDVSKAVNQLKNRRETYRLIILASPLHWQLSPSVLEYMLTGLDTLLISQGKIVSYSKKGVPIKRSTAHIIDGVLYIYGEDFDERKLWLLNSKNPNIFLELCTEQTALFQ